MRKVLLIDQNPTRARARADILRKNGYETAVENDPWNGLETARQNPFDSVIYVFGQRAGENNVPDYMERALPNAQILAYTQDGSWKPLDRSRISINMLRNYTNKKLFESAFAQQEAA